jgi:acetate kinase
MTLLVVDAGSSSLKLARLEPPDVFLGGCGPVDAVGHRVVHGGPRYTGPAG